jgi:hypothetical protein
VASTFFSRFAGPTKSNERHSVFLLAFSCLWGKIRYAPGKTAEKKPKARDKVFAFHFERAESGTRGEKEKKFRRLALTEL